MPVPQVPKTPRPNINDARVATAAAVALYPKVAAWMVSAGDAKDDVEKERQSIVDELAGELRHENDGYCLAKALGRNGWEADFALAEIMDNAIFAKHNALTALVKAWLPDSGLTAYPVGAAVRVPLSVGKDLTGTITSNNEAEGTASVYIEALGHIRPGTGKSGTLGAILGWEEIAPVEASA